MPVSALLFCSPEQAPSLEPQLAREGLSLQVCHSIEQARALQKAHRLTLALATTSVRHAALKTLPGLELVLLGPDRSEAARRQLRDGAADWLTLPLRGSEVQRMLSFHRRRMDQAQSAELLSVATVIAALNRCLKTDAAPELLRGVVRAGGVLSRSDAGPGKPIAAVQAAVTLAKVATEMAVNVHTDPSLSPVLLSTPKIGRAVLHMLMSSSRQGASLASVSAVQIRDRVEISVYNDAPLGPHGAFSTAPLHRLVGAVGGQVELTSTTGTGLQVQMSLPVFKD